MYTLIPARLLSVCSSDVGRSSWRGGAGIIKPWRGTSGTLLSAIRGSLQCVLIFLGPVNVQPGLFSIGTWVWAWLESSPPPAPTLPRLLTRAVDIESSKHSLRDVLLGTQPKSQMKVTWRLPEEGNEASIHTHRHYFFFPSFIKSNTHVHNSYFVDQMTKPYICLIDWLRNCIFPEITTIFQTTNKAKSTYLLLWLQ